MMYQSGAFRAVQGGILALCLACFTHPALAQGGSILEEVLVTAQ